MRLPPHLLKRLETFSVAHYFRHISCPLSQVIGQAGSALKMAQEALGRENGAQPAAKRTVPEPQK